jgi:6-phosphogluconolactonase
MLFLVSGGDKRDILARVLSDPTLPAARARSLNKTTWLVDAAAMPEPNHAG